MANINKDPKFTLMAGTEGGKTYLAFAQKDGAALGAKLVDIRPGAKYGVPGTTWFGVYLRSATVDGVFDDPSADANVVKFQKKISDFGAVWPGVEWSKNDDRRASTTLALLMPGDLGTVSGAQELLTGIVGGKLALKVAEYLTKIAQAAGGQHELNVEEIAEWFSTPLDQFIEKVREALARHEAVKHEMAGSVGVFHDQAALLKKAYKTTKKDDPEDDDLDGDEDADEDDFGEFEDTPPPKKKSKGKKHGQDDHVEDAEA